MGTAWTRIDRRAACAALAGMGLGLIWPRLTARAEDWTCRVITLEAEAGAVHPPVVSAVALHPNGKAIALAGDDHRIRIVDIESGKTLEQRPAHGDWVRALAYSPTGDVLASAGNDGRIVLWNAASAQQLNELAALAHPVVAIAFNPSGQSLASTGYAEDVRVFDVTGHKQTARLSGPCPDMRALAYSPDLRHLASGGRNGIVRVWDVPAGKVIQEYKAHQRRVWGVAFSPDGRTIVSCGEDGKTRFQPLGGNDHFVLDSPGAKVMSLAYCGPEHLATGGSDNLVRIWDVSRRAQVAELAGHTGSVVTLAYGGNVLISAGYDTTVRVWTSNSNLVRGSTTPSDRVGSRWEPRSRAQQ